MVVGSGMRGARTMAVWLLVVGALGMTTADVASARNLDGFARCLGRRRATFYGTSWCPHCDAQRALFGRAFRWVPYVECSIDGTQAIRPECAGVSGFPTWVFRDGSRISGRLSLDRLARETGCSLDEPAPEALIIDVPAGGRTVPVPSDAGVQIIEIP